jgi:small subunit ribosomal protein S8
VSYLPQKICFCRAYPWRDQVQLVSWKPASLKEFTHMSMTDPIADMLTRIRNGCMARLQKVDIPSSNMKVSIASVLKNEGFIKNYKIISDQKQNILRVYLKYVNEKESVINEIKRVSKPGSRVYVRSENIPRVKNGYGVAIISSSKGIITDKTARQEGVGGELLCTVW